MSACMEAAHRDSADQPRTVEPVEAGNLALKTFNCVGRGVKPRGLPLREIISRCSVRDIIDGVLQLSCRSCNVLQGKLEWIMGYAGSEVTFLDLGSGCRFSCPGWGICAMSLLTVSCCQL
jgi:hypothetical protein